MLSSNFILTQEKKDVIRNIWCGTECWISLGCCSIAKSYPTVRSHMDYSIPGFPVSYHPPEYPQIHVHWIGDAIQPSHPLPSSSSLPSIFSQHQCLFHWVHCSHKWPKYWSFTWEPRIPWPTFLQEGLESDSTGLWL